MTDRRHVLAGLGATALAAGVCRFAPPALAQSFMSARVPSELVNEVPELAGRVTLGNPAPDVAIVEFFDYNCPWCRQSAKDIPELLKSEPDLAYVLVNFPVLSRPSIEAARIALAFARRHEAARSFALHQKLFALKGTVDGQRAFDAAAELGADKERLLKEADSDAVTGAMKAAVALGNNLGLTATPSYLVLTEAYQGYVPLAKKRHILAEVRRCDEVSC